MRRTIGWIVLAALIVAALVFRPDRALRVATGLSSQILCNAVFVSGLDGAGTQVGAIGMSAPARDWARFGQLYLDDGVAPGGARILPEGWVAMSRTPTLGSLYGAGFWTTAGDGEDAQRLVARGMPKGAFFASGNLGQRIYIVPSERLVLVRLGVSFGERNGLDADLDFMNAVIARSHDPAVAAGPPLTPNTAE